MRRTKEDAEQTRRAILASAMDLFYEKGYSKTTFDEVAKRINLTKGAVYWYFRNKPDIVAALINEYASSHLEVLRQMVAEKECVNFDDLLEMLLYSNKCLRDDPKIYKFVFFLVCQMEWSESILTKIEPLVKQTKEFSHGLIFNALQTMQKNNKIKPDVDIKTITEIIISMQGGFTERFLKRRLTCDYDEITKTGLNLIFNNIKTERDNNEN